MSGALAFLGSVGHVLDYAQQEQQRQQQFQLEKMKAQQAAAQFQFTQQQMQADQMIGKTKLLQNLVKTKQAAQGDQQQDPSQVMYGAQPHPSLTQAPQQGRPGAAAGSPGNALMGGLPGSGGLAPEGGQQPTQGQMQAPAGQDGPPPQPSWQQSRDSFVKAIEQQAGVPVAKMPPVMQQRVLQSAQENYKQEIETWKNDLQVWKTKTEIADRRDNQAANREIRLQGLDLAAQNHADMVTLRKMQMAQSEQDRQMALQMRRQEFDIAQGERHTEFVEREQDRHWQETHRPPTASELKEINTSSDVSGILDDIDSLSTRLGAVRGPDGKFMFGEDAPPAAPGAASVGLAGLGKRAFETVTGPFGGDQSNRIFADDLTELRSRLLRAVGRGSYLTKADREEANKLVLGLNPGDNPARTINSLNNATKWLTTKFGPILKKYPGGEALAPEAPPAEPAESSGGKTYNFDPKTGALVPQ